MSFKSITLVSLGAAFAVACHSSSSSSPSSSGGGGHPKVVLQTNQGDITVELDGEKAPISVQNFLTYVNEGFYGGLTFHRVINGFMIQGGGFSPEMVEKHSSHPSIKNEGQNGLKNKRGTLAMARTNVVDSATSQFYINVVDNPALDYPSNGGYAVFGEVIGGMDVVDKIKAMPTHNAPNGMPNVPTEPVIIQSARQLK